jgi:putative membrane protein
VNYFNNPPVKVNNDSDMIDIMPSHKHYIVILGLSFLLFAGFLAMNPVDRHDWMLENVLTVVFIIILVATFRTFPLSRISYTLIFLFLLLHETGAHFTYAKVPYDQAFQSLFGFSLNERLGFERNHFDRLVHFCYGLLLAYPIRELFLRIANVRGFWGYFLPLDLTMSTSMLFELFEWGAAEWFGGDLGIAYLGTQGDVWDAHKDMALASLGALVTMIIVAIINSSIYRDFAHEWNESLRIKQRKPFDYDLNP